MRIKDYWPFYDAFISFGDGYISHYRVRADSADLAIELTLEQDNDSCLELVSTDYCTVECTYVECPDGTRVDYSD